MTNKEELLSKLEQIQEQANLTLEELPLRLAKDRLRLIIGLARYLATEIEFKWDYSAQRLPGDRPPPREPLAS